MRRASPAPATTCGDRLAAGTRRAPPTAAWPYRSFSNPTGSSTSTRHAEARHGPLPRRKPPWPKAGPKTGPKTEPKPEPPRFPRLRCGRRRRLASVWVLVRFGLGGRPRTQSGHGQGGGRVAGIARRAPAAPRPDGLGRSPAQCLALRTAQPARRRLARHEAGADGGRLGPDRLVAQRARARASPRATAPRAHAG